MTLSTVPSISSLSLVLRLQVLSTCSRAFTVCSCCAMYSCRYVSSWGFKWSSTIPKTLNYNTRTIIRDLRSKTVIYTDMNYIITKRRWLNGTILACHAGGPGSIPGRRRLLLLKIFHFRIEELQFISLISRVLKQ